MVALGALVRRVVVRARMEWTVVPPGDLGHGVRGEGSLPVAPGIAPAIDDLASGSGLGFVVPPDYEAVDARTVLVTGLALVIGLAVGVVAQGLIALIGFVTNLAFYGRLSIVFASPADAHRGAPLVVLVPIAGALIVGVMARFGSAAIRGHGIPEVMERILLGESRIAARLMFLKPLSAAVAIGTGGPFGAEGPIIATGGALGSVVGQILRVTADERKTLLAAGAAAGMAATFGSPVSAVLLAIELLLFEYRPRSIIPVALAAVVATGVRIAFNGSAPVFAIPALERPSDSALLAYALLGALMGVVAVGITKVAYGIEDVFESLGHRFGVHWMWWPAFGALVVGLVGWAEPRTLGVGYENIVATLSGSLAGRALLVLVLLKFVSWAVYLGSGTSGGTLAPLFTIGGGLGAWIGGLLAAASPALGIDPRVAALVGMAAIFAGASHALLASVVFAFETTRQPLGLLPLLAGCASAYLVSLLLSRNSIMTEKLSRRGTAVRTEYAVDHLAHVLVRDVATRDVVSLAADDLLSGARAWLAGELADARATSSHQGFPVVDEEGRLVGVVTRRDLLDPRHDDECRIAEIVRRPPAVVFEDSTLRDAADHMVVERVGRLPVVSRADWSRVVGIISRSDLLAAHAPRISASTHRGDQVRTGATTQPVSSAGTARK
jgi:CIC family chloride channel protein